MPIAVTSIGIPTQDYVKAYFDSAMTNCTNQIPYTRKGRSLIFLGRLFIFNSKILFFLIFFIGGTAGLRLSNITNPSYTQTLLSAIRSYFSTLGLMFNAPEYQVRIISGSEEGLSGWISVNMLMQELFVNNKPLETFGVLDMGGMEEKKIILSINFFFVYV